MFSFKSFKTTAVAGVLILGSAAGFSIDASAASATGLATIDWSSFKIQALGDGQSVNFGLQSDTTVASAASNGVDPLITVGPNVTFNWNDTSFSQADTGAAHYNGRSTATTPGLDSTQEPPVLTGAFQSESKAFADAPAWTVNVDSTATRSLDFSMTGSGLVVFSVEYSLFASTDGGSASIANDTASAAARVSALLRNLTNNGSPLGTSTSNIGASFDVAADNFGSTETSAGTLAVVMFFNDGDLGHLDISADSSAATSSPAAVPLPPAGWLLGASLVMLARRRRV